MKLFKQQVACEAQSRVVQGTHWMLSDAAWLLLKWLSRIDSASFFTARRSILLPFRPRFESSLLSPRTAGARLVCFPCAVSLRDVHALL